MTQFHENLTRVICQCLALAVLFALASCGDNPSSPTAAAAPEVAAKRSVRSVLSAKENTAEDGGYVIEIATPSARTAQATIGPDGGQMVVDETGGNPRDDLLVIFAIPPGALAEPTPITMRVTGDQLCGLVVDFDPSGVRFSPYATLHCTVGSDRVDCPVDALASVHIYDDDTEEAVDSAVYHAGNSKSYELWVDVPGFSRYGLRRN